MKKIAFIFTILFLSLLIVLNQLLPPKTLYSLEELSQFEQNQKFLVNGNIVKETYSNNYKILHLDNELQLQCDLSCTSFLNKNITALVILEKYNNKNYLKILKIKAL